MMTSRITTSGAACRASRSSASPPAGGDLGGVAERVEQRAQVLAAGLVVVDNQTDNVRHRIRSIMTCSWRAARDCTLACHRDQVHASVPCGRRMSSPRAYARAERHVFARRASRLCTWSAIARRERALSPGGTRFAETYATAITGETTWEQRGQDLGSEERKLRGSKREEIGESAAAARRASRAAGEINERVVGFIKERPGTSILIAAASRLSHRPHPAVVTTLKGDRTMDQQDRTSSSALGIETEIELLAWRWPASASAAWSARRWRSWWRPRAAASCAAI